MAGNAQKIIDAARTAYAQGARLVLTPELSICGYAAEDLFLRPAFIAACDDAVKTVARELAGLKGMQVVVGHPTGGDIRSRSVPGAAAPQCGQRISEGRVLETYAKRELPNYQVFDERRYFTPGQGTCVFQVEDVNVGLLICEDAWFDEPGAARQGVGRRTAGRHQRLALPRRQGRRAGGAHGRAGPRAGPAAGLCAPGGRAGRGGLRWRILRRERRRQPGRAGAGFQEDLFYVQAERGGRRVELQRPHGARAQPRGGTVGRAGAGRARLHRKERLSRRAAGPVGRHRLGAGAGRRGGRARQATRCAR